MYSEFHNINSKGWNRLSFIPFNPIPEDSITEGAIHDVILVLRHNDFTPSDSIWIAVQETSFGNIIRNDTIPLSLAYPSGSWKGNGAHGIYQISDTLHSFSKLPAGYELSISHAMKPQIIPGIINVGIILSRRPQKSE